ncbi:rod-binding protein [Rhodobacter capsulatus]|uniref:rod-binding protein n=1 Tax=Rhodobacter capsulatus TaxID=1061 RepID=UPI004026301E
MDTRPLMASPPQAAPDRKAADEKALRLKAQELEASFLAEMLKHSGLGKTQEGFNGGIGEEQFASFLIDEYASMMVKSGGIGLAESIFQSLQKGAEHAE